MSPSSRQSLGPLNCKSLLVGEYDDYTPYLVCITYDTPVLDGKDRTDMVLSLRTHLMRLKFVVLCKRSCFTKGPGGRPEVFIFTPGSGLFT